MHHLGEASQAWVTPVRSAGLLILRQGAHCLNPWAHLPVLLCFLGDGLGSSPKGREHVTSNPRHTCQCCFIFERICWAPRPWTRGTLLPPPPGSTCLYPCIMDRGHIATTTARQHMPLYMHHGIHSRPCMACYREHGVLVPGSEDRAMPCP